MKREKEKSLRLTLNSCRKHFNVSKEAIEEGKVHCRKDLHNAHYYSLDFIALVRSLTSFW